MRIALRNCEYTILSALERKPLHGYGILRVMKEQGTPLPPATTYNALRRLYCLGLLQEERRETSHGPVQKVYRLTYQGRRHVERRNADILVRIEELHATYKAKICALRQLL